MTDLLEEIKHEVHRDRLVSLGKRYGKYLIVLVGAVIIAASLAVWIKNKNTENQQNIGKLVYQAVEAINNDQEVTSILDSIKKEDEAFVVFPELQRAGLLYTQGKKEESIALYKEIAANNAIDSTYRKWAELLRISQQINTDIATVSPEDKKILEDSAKEEAEWKFFALEQQALIAIKENNTKQAVELLETIKNGTDVPVLMQNRVKELIAVLQKSDADNTEKESAS